MASRGYWFNKIKQKYTTNKYPHCYVGVINKLNDTSSYWGVLNKQGICSHFSTLNKKGISAYFGNDNEEVYNMLYSFTKNLNQTDFYYDFRDGFNMAVEKEWHMVDPISIPTSNKTDLYDVELNKLNDSDYGIRLFYKLVLPLSSFSDSGITNNDLLAKYNNAYYSTTFERASIGSPCLPFYNYSSSGLRCLKGLVLDKNLTASGAYQIPSNNILNNTSIPNSDFAVGATIADGYAGFKLDGKTFSIRNDASIIPSTYTKFNSPNYLFMSRSLEVTDGYQGFQGMQVSDTTVTYSVDTSAALMNIPVYSNNSSTNLKFMPRLFEPFGLMLFAEGNIGRLYNDNYTTQLKNISGWIYYVFGTTTLN